MHPASRHKTREERLPFHGQVRLLIPFAPYKLLFSLSAKNISLSGLAASLDGKSGRKAKAPSQPPPVSVEELAVLLSEGDPCELQIEHGEEHLPVPILLSRLVRKDLSQGRLNMGFAFEAPTPDLLSLIHELSGGGSQS